MREAEIRHRIKVILSKLREAEEWQAEAKIDTRRLLDDMKKEEAGETPASSRLRSKTGMDYIGNLCDDLRSTVHRVYLSTSPNTTADKRANVRPRLTNRTYMAVLHIMPPSA